MQNLLRSDPRGFIARSTAFIEYMVDWHEKLQPFALESVIAGAGGAQGVAVMLIDLIEGFARAGNLASPRVEALIEPILTMVTDARSLGVRTFISVQDAHSPDSPEFDEFGPHCIEGTPEAQLVRELAAHPVFSDLTTIGKKSLNAFLNSQLDEYLEVHPGLRSFIIAGDCTDLCVYHAAMHLKMRENTRDGRDPSSRLEIIVPASLVQTYDLPVETASRLGLKAHDGDFFHLAFLYHMHLNGITVVSDIVRA